MFYSKDKKPYVPDEWVACWAENRNMWYYGNKLTRKSQWHAPEGAFFPKDDDLSLHRQTAQTSAQEVFVEDSQEHSLQQLNECISSAKDYQLLQSDTLANYPINSTEEENAFPQPPGRMTKIQKAIVMFFPFLLTGTFLGVFFLFHEW